MYQERQQEVELPKHSEETDAQYGHRHDRRKKDQLDEVDEELPVAHVTICTFVLVKRYRCMHTYKQTHTHTHTYVINIHTRTLRIYALASLFVLRTIVLVKRYTIIQTCAHTHTHTHTHK